MHTAAAMCCRASSATRANTANGCNTGANPNPTGAGGKLQEGVESQRHSVVFRIHPLKRRRVVVFLAGCRNDPDRTDDVSQSQGRNFV